MNIFFTREETESHVVITMTPWWLYVSLCLVAVMLIPIIGQAEGQGVGTLSTLAFWALLILTLLRLVQMRGVRKEMFVAMRAGTIEVSGSRFNPGNPVTVKILKPEQAAPETTTP